MKKDTSRVADDNDLRQRAEERLISRMAETDIAHHSKAEMARLLHELQVHQIELEMQNDELRRSEEEVREYAAELAAIYQYSPCIMVLIDEERRIRKANGFAAAFAGGQATELFGARWGVALSCLHALDNPQGCGFGPSCQECTIRRLVLDTIETGSVHHQVETSMDVSGAEKSGRFVFLLSCVRLDIHGEPMALVNLLDITDRKQAEEKRKQVSEQLRQSEKMAAIGQLAGGIAHNFNNQLAGILGYGDLLFNDLEDERLRSYVSNIIKSSQHAGDIAAQLLAFSRKGKYLSAPMDLHCLIGETALLLWNSIDRRIEIQQHLHADHATVIGDPVQMQSMLLNLGINARDAMPHGGQLVFSTETVELSGKRAATLGVQPGHHLHLTVADSGSGMTPETQKHLFEPFFTTKEVGKGTGLGLAAVYGIIANHNGAITVQSEPGKGSTFSIYLPLGDKLDISQTVERVTTPMKGQARVLLVDDESIVLEMGKHMLRHLGYEVTTCADGTEAVALYRKCGEQIDLVILDIVMPIMCGRDTFAALREINPAVKVLVSSGYSIDDEARAIMDDGANAFLQKPFTITELSLKVAEALQK